jgi:hypothetical protein
MTKIKDPDKKADSYREATKKKRKRTSKMVEVILSSFLRNDFVIYDKIAYKKIKVWPQYGLFKRLL